MTLAELNKITDYTSLDKILVKYRDEEDYLNGFNEINEEELRKKEDDWNVEFMSMNKLWIDSEEALVMMLYLQKN